MVLSPENTLATPNNQEKTEKNSLQNEKEQVQVKVDASIPAQKDNNEDDPNFKAFREARKKDKALREAAEQKALEKQAEVEALKAAMEAAFSKSAPSPQAYQQHYSTNEPDEETEDQRIEKKVNELLAVREQRYKQEQADRERQEYPNKLMREFPDFNNVVSQENLDYIDYHFPEVSRPLQRLNDDYDKWSDIYKAIKKFVPNNTSARKDAIKADNNFNKPKSISSTNLTQSGEGNKESWQQIEQRRAENWARMERLRKQV